MLSLSICSSNQRTGSSAVAFRTGYLSRSRFGLRPHVLQINEKKTGVKIRPKKVTPSIPKKTAVPRAWSISAPAPFAITSGNTPRMKAKEVIRIGRKPQPGRLGRRLQSPATGLHLLSRKLNNQNRILTGKADQHDESDLRENIVVLSSRVNSDHRRQQTHGHDQNYR